MRRLAGIFGVLGVLLSTFMLMGTGPAFACKCIVADTPRYAEMADAVFTGTVTSVAKDRQTATYDVRVDRVYKGTVDTDTVDTAGSGDVVITSSSQSAACGVDLPESTEAVFFVSSDPDGLRMTSCGGTSVATPALTAEVAAALGDGTSPGQTRDAVPIDHGAQAATDNTGMYVAVGLGIFALAAAALFGWALSRRKRA